MLVKFASDTVRETDKLHNEKITFYNYRLVPKMDAIDAAHRNMNLEYIFNEHIGWLIKWKTFRTQLINPFYEYDDGSSILKMMPPI